MGQVAAGALSAAFSAALASPAVGAKDPGGDSRADVDERVAELEASLGPRVQPAMDTVASGLMVQTWAP